MATKEEVCGGHATLRYELSELTFRKEKFQYVHQFYECDETKERFTTTALDEVNVGQVYNQYRAKYGIPFPDEIKRIRQRYGLPASKMSQILGFGDNQYRLYENGDMPSEANGKILSLKIIFLMEAEGIFSMVMPPSLSANSKTSSFSI